MTTRKIVILSGPDRTGKSTLSAALQNRLGADSCEVVHLPEPPGNQNNLFDVNREAIGEWVASGKEWLIFDRCYVCSYVLETLRRRNNGHLDDIIDLELELLECAEEFKVLHVGVEKQWAWSAPHHLAELKQLFPTAAPWKIRDEYIARMKEHREYSEKLGEFYNHVTAFPHIYTFDTNKKPNIQNLLDNINYEIE